MVALSGVFKDQWQCEDEPENGCRGCLLGIEIDAQVLFTMGVILLVKKLYTCKVEVDAYS